MTIGGRERRSTTWTWRLHRLPTTYQPPIPCNINRVSVWKLVSRDLLIVIIATLWSLSHNTKSGRSRSVGEFVWSQQCFNAQMLPSCWLILLTSTICHCSQMHLLINLHKLQQVFLSRNVDLRLPQSKSMWSKLPYDCSSLSYPNVSTWDVCIELCLWSCVHLSFSIWLWHHPVEIIMQSPAPIYNVKWKTKVRLEIQFTASTRLLGPGQSFHRSRWHHKRWRQQSELRVGVFYDKIINIWRREYSGAMVSLQPRFVRCWFYASVRYILNHSLVHLIKRQNYRHRSI